VAWSTSNISAAGLDQLLNGTFYATNAGTSYAADSILVALYNNSVTPNKNDTLANNQYATGTWSGNELTSAGQWAAGGVALGSKTHTFGSGTVQISAANTASGNAATLTAVFGCLVYDNTLTAKYAYCWNYFGGSQSVTAGTFTVVWSGSGILQFTIT
jgi:hypothetical protein